MVSLQNLLPGASTGGVRYPAKKGCSHIVSRSYCSISQQCLSDDTKLECMLVRG